MTIIDFRHPIVAAALQELQPLAAVIADTVHTTPVRIGPGGDEDLVAELTLAVALFCARHVLPAEAAELADPPFQPTRRWVLETPSRDAWTPYGGGYDNREDALNDFKETVARYQGKRRLFRVLRATTTYAVEAVHIPAEAAP
ncbi:hypothetical protein [Streptomyces sp. NPDC001914]|uniref:hypothetical protein n=1 Tax=Streptomyces sp. NPDC001914 TaxID=3364623 RepID=UPI0036817077